MILPELDARLQAVRSQYRAAPWIQPRDDESPLLRSWQRCRDAGMHEHESVNFELVSRSWLAELDDVHGALVRHARNETERLAQCLRGTGLTVLLFNTRGVIIDRLCHEATTPNPLRHATRIGVNVAERCVGTTAPAIAITDGLPYLVGRDAHFFNNMKPFFCVAAPIDSPQGERLGALDVTAYDSVPSFDIFSLVVDAATAIENGLFSASRERLLMHFHVRAELVGTTLEALLEVDESGRITAANRMAARLLCRPRSALSGQRFDTLFDRRVQHLFGHSGRQGTDLVELRSHDGLQLLARFESDSTQRLTASPAPADLTTTQGPGQALPRPAVAPSMREVECRTIEAALAASSGNVSAAARQLGISRNTIYRRMQAHSTATATDAADRG